MSERDGQGRFTGGHKKIGGRPKGAKNRFTSLKDAFVASFENGGEAALDRLRDEDPKAFFQIFRDLFPRQIEQKVDATNVEYSMPDIPPRSKDYREWLEHREIEAEFLKARGEAGNAA